MKASMSDFLYTMTESDCDRLYDIFTNKYRKFISAYWLLKKYSNFIVGIDCDEKVSKHELKLKITVAGMKPSVLCNALLKESHSFFGDVDVKCSGKSSVKIHIYREEEDVSI